MNILKNNCWVIKVSFLQYRNVNFNEAYWDFDKCMSAIRKKIEDKNYIKIDEYTIKDLDNEIIYEAKLVDIFE